MTARHPGFRLPWLALVLALTVSGCGALRPHSEIRDKQGVAAKTAWSAVDLNALIAAERTNLKTLLDAELATQDSVASGIRDHELRSFLAAETLQEGLVDRVAKRLVEAAGSAAQVEQSRTAYADMQARTDMVAEYDRLFAALKLARPSCTSVAAEAIPPKIVQWKAKADARSVALLEPILKNYREHCAGGSDDIVDTVYSTLGGNVGKAAAQLRSDQAAYSALEAKSVDARAAYETALKEYTEATKTADGIDLAGKVGAAKGKLETALGTLEKAQDAFSVQFLSKEKLAALDAFVKEVTQADADDKMPDGAGKASTAFILLSNLVEDARKSLTDAKRPLALPLLMHRNHEQLRLEAATSEINARKAIVALSRELVDVAYEEAVQLWHASRDLEQVPALHNQPVLKAFATADTIPKTHVYRAAASYFDAVNRHTAQRYKLEYMRIAAHHELGLAYADVNIRQWTSLIGITVDQVASASASGIKAESVSALLNTIGVLWIGRGVNHD